MNASQADASIYSQMKNSGYNKYFIELDCAARISRGLFGKFMDLACG